MYKLLALDIDDTLLNREGKLSKRNKEAIEKAVEAGAVVTIATGRAYDSAVPICKMIGLATMPVITFGGACIIEYPTGKMLHYNYLSPEMVKEGIEFAKQQGVYVQVYDGSDFLYEQECEESIFYSTRLNRTGKVVDFSTQEFNRSSKCLLCVTEDKIDALEKKAKAHFGTRAYITKSHKRLLEIYNPEVNKGAALAIMANIFDIKQYQIIAMGDTGIDVPMIEYAGLGVAVENAMQECKDVADLITVDANDDAVAEIIQTYILS